MCMGKRFSCSSQGKISVIKGYDWIFIDNSVSHSYNALIIVYIKLFHSIRRSYSYPDGRTNSDCTASRKQMGREALKPLELSQIYCHTWQKKKKRKTTKKPKTTQKNNNKKTNKPPERQPTNQTKPLKGYLAITTEGPREINLDIECKTIPKFKVKKNKNIKPILPCVEKVVMF